MGRLFKKFCINSSTNYPSCSTLGIGTISYNINIIQELENILFTSYTTNKFCSFIKLFCFYDHIQSLWSVQLFLSSSWSHFLFNPVIIHAFRSADFYYLKMLSFTNSKKIITKVYIQNLKEKNGVKAFVKNCFKVSKIKNKSLIWEPFINLIAKIYYLIRKCQQILLILGDKNVIQHTHNGEWYLRWSDLRVSVGLLAASAAHTLVHMVQ